MAEFIGFFSSIFGYVLNFIYEFINNYGFAIIIFSILLKILLFPFSLKQQKSAKKSAKIQKEANEIKNKYGKDLEKVNQETMALYKREKMSPFSGCLSAIFQLVIVFAMFYLVRSPLTFMRHIDNDIINNYTNQINESIEEGQNKSVYPEIEIIKEKGKEDENVYINMGFFGLDLSLVPQQNLDKPQMYILPLLYVVSSVISMRLAMPQKEKKKKEDNKYIENGEDLMSTFAETNKTMTMFMPIMYVMMAMMAPLGLALYWLINNLLSIGERMIINKIISKEAIEGEQK